MPTLRELTEYCDARTARADVVDFPGAVNGLQVENDGNIAKIGAAVDAGLRVFEEAARRAKQETDDRHAATIADLRNALEERYEHRGLDDLANSIYGVLERGSND